MSLLASSSWLSMPPIGLGTMSINGEAVPKAIKSAIDLGYRRIDCAPVYFNEELIGDALSEILQSNVVKREDLFITSKLASPFHRKEHVELALRKTLSDLRLDYLDLYLIHWPVSFYFVDIDVNVRGYPDEAIDDSGDGKKIDPTVSIHETWRVMEALVDKGLVRHIGVSNFPISLLHELLTSTRIHPAVNQVELHPYNQQRNLVNYCHKRGVHVQAYSPLGTPGYKETEEPTVLDDPVLIEIAKKRGIPVSQLCLMWALQRGTSVVAKSASEAHQRENLKVLQSAPPLSDEEVGRIEGLNRGYRYFRPEDWWGEMHMAVFD